jgi:outer membrane protein assembly factor BamB
MNLLGRTAAVNRLSLAGGLLLVCGLMAARAENWPAWRGPDHNGLSKETNLPTVWGENKNVLWKLPLPGKGGATPAIWGDNIFLTYGAGKELGLMCVGTDGKERWRKPVGTATRLSVGPGKEEGNQASPSPSTDGKHVYAFFGNGDFVCFDFAGKQIWKFNANDRYGPIKIMHGVHPTPLLHGNRLYLALLHDGGHWVVALDKATGNEAWKIARPSDAKNEGKQAYTSPCLWQEGKETHLIVSGNDYATAHRLDDGSEVWRLGDLNPPKPGARYNQMYRLIASPVASKDLLVVPTMRVGPVVGVKPGAQGLVKTGNPFEMWRYWVSPDVASPLILDGLVYLCTEDRGTGKLVCLDGKTGQKLYEEPLQRSRYRASPVVADGKIYLAARDGGTVSVVKPGPKFELLATNTLDDEFAASPAISGGRIYLRGYGHLYAISTK